MSNSLWPHGLYSPWNSPGQNTGVGSLSLLQGIYPTHGLKPGILHFRWILLPAEPQGKPKNTGVGSLSLLQRTFQIQESNWGLLHCRQILYQLSYKERQQATNSSEHSYVHHGITHNSQEVATAEILIDGWMDRENVVYLYNETQRFPKNLTIELSYDSTILLLGIYLRKIWF